MAMIACLGPPGTFRGRVATGSGPPAASCRAGTFDNQIRFQGDLV